MEKIVYQVTRAQTPTNLVNTINQEETHIENKSLIPQYLSNMAQVLIVELNPNYHLGSLKASNDLTIRFQEIATTIREVFVEFFRNIGVYL